MRRVVLGLAVCSFLVSPSPRAGEKPGGKDKEAFARELDLKGFPVEPSRGNVRRPFRITNADELTRVTADKEWQERIAKQVDFAKEDLLFFAWSGSGGDKLTLRFEEEKKGIVAVFSYSAGATDDLRHYVRLYAIAKKGDWRIEVK